MKYITGAVSEDEINKLVELFGFHIFSSHLGTTSSLLGENFERKKTKTFESEIIDRLKNLLPASALDGYESELYSLEIDKNFLTGLKNHLAFNTELSYLHSKANMVGTKQFFEEAVNVLSEYGVSGNNRYNQPEESYNRNVKDHHGPNLKLVKKTESQSYEVLTTIAPFLAFISIHYDGYRLINKVTQTAKPSIEKYENIKGYVDLFGKYITKLPPEIQVCSAYLFEREHNVYLVKAIHEADKSHFNNLDAVNKVLSLISILPNVISRTHLVKTLCEMPLLQRPKKRTTSRIHENHKISMPAEQIWYASATDIIIRLAYVSIPVLEMLHLYLYREYGINKDEPNENKSELLQKDGLSGVLNYTDSPLVGVPLNEFDNIIKHIQKTRSVIGSNPPRKMLMNIKAVPFPKEDDIKGILERNLKVTSQIDEELRKLTKKFARKLDLILE
ncbi:hypothetical protein MO973_20740 [Paenibacillus sp. TRM 82003]|nr:hypothetical protein [Paenibacillus sp. TRM 82003]